MKKLEIIKHIAFIVFVPSVVVGGYYGYKYIKKKYDERKLASNSVSDYSNFEFYRMTYDFDYSMPSKIAEALINTSFSPLKDAVKTSPDGKRITVQEGAIMSDKVDGLKEALKVFGDKVILTKFDLKDSLTLSDKEVKNIENSK